jgi:hypothetical protein
MLFDLRGRGRRRTVRVIYVGLALLMGVGLIGFGVGGGVGGGGLLTGSSNSEGANKASFASQIKKYQKLVAKQPSDVSAWESLTSAQLHEAGGEAYVANNKLTSKGKELFSQVAQSWNSYLALNPPKPSLTLAKEMVRVFGEEGLNQPAAAVTVLQIVVAAEPQSASLFGALAEYAYKAHNTRQGDLASTKAVSLAPSADRVRLKKELAELKKSSAATTTTSSGATSSPTTSGTTTSSATSPGSNGTGAASTGESANATITVGGKTYKVTQKVKEELESSKKK